MGAYVQYKFNKGFVLNEEKLRKIIDYLSKKDGNENGIQYQLKIYRKDAFTYSTKDVNELINTENDSPYNLERIEFVSQNNSEYEFMLKFDANKNTALSISGNDRDFVYVLYSDLKNYINKEVCTCTTINTDSSFMRLLLPLSMMICLFLIVTFEMPSPPNIADAIESNNVNEKLNMLLMLQDRRPNMLYIPILMPILLMLLFMLPWKKIWRYIYPSNVFLFGKSIAEFDNKKKLRSNLFWIIIVGFIISITAGAVLLKLTN